MPLLPEALVIAAVALLALTLRPWRQLAAGSTLNLPLMAAALLLPLVWATPYLGSAKSIAPHWSAAPLVVLVLGWPLAIMVFIASAAALWVLGIANEAQALQTLVWQGILPATLALLPGWWIRAQRWHHILVYLFVRAFLGTVFSVVTAYALAHFYGVPLLNLRDTSLSLVGLWLMAWGDGIITGMLVSIFAVYKPAWLATWSDAIYLQKPMAKEAQ